MLCPSSTSTKYTTPPPAPTDELPSTCASHAFVCHLLTATCHTVGPLPIPPPSTLHHSPSTGETWAAHESSDDILSPAPSILPHISHAFNWLSSCCNSMISSTTITANSRPSTAGAPHHRHSYETTPPANKKPSCADCIYILFSLSFTCASSFPLSLPHPHSASHVTLQIMIIVAMRQKAELQSCTTSPCTCAFKRSLSNYSGRTAASQFHLLFRAMLSCRCSSVRAIVTASRFFLLSDWLRLHSSCPPFAYPHCSFGHVMQTAGPKLKH